MAVWEVGLDKLSGSKSPFPATCKIRFIVTSLQMVQTPE
jgi:hypothetical protein